MSSKLWDEYDAALDELDREYYLSKIEELSRCLPVVRAAQALVGSWYAWNDAPDDTGVVEAVEAYEAAKEARDE